MPTLPEEEEDSPEELESTSSSPSSYAPVESKVVTVTMTPPAIVLQRQVSKQEPCPLEKARPHSPRPRLSRNSASLNPITTLDDEGHVIDLVKDQLPELQLSAEDRQKNLELLEEAKKVSDRFLQRRGRRSTCSLTESPTALSPNPTPCSSPIPSRSSSLSAPLGPEVTTTPPASPQVPHTTQRLQVPSTHDHGDTSKLEQQEHKLIRIQSISSSKLPDLSEAAEQERGPPSLLTSSPSEEEMKEKADAMPNISDIMLHKLKPHRGLSGCAPPLSEKEAENTFVQLSLAFRNDNYTLESRLKQAERERILTEENTEKELEEFKCSLKNTSSLWLNVEQREFYQHLIETVTVLHCLTNRLSSRAEMVGAVRQEKRMNKATEVMMQYVENLKRTYEKDHAELMEFKKLANQNSNRCYGGSVDTGDDGVPRASRSMSLQMGKALPRRRVSVAVVPKFNLLNIPGQTSATAGPVGALPVVCEAGTIKNGSSTDPNQQDVLEKPSENPLTEQESETMSNKLLCSPEKISEEIRAKIEEAAYNRGYQEGLKRSKELQELKEEEEKAEEKQKDFEEEIRGNADKDRKTNSRFEEALEILDRIFPKFFRRNRMLWIILTLFFVSFVFVSVINFFSNRYSDSGDTSAEKSALAGKKKFFGLNVGPKTPAPE
ncbi:inositol 1,4,5-triphosphate receptor associated 1-like isoform X4 [Myxocyprinus asiaticus]|uniref:inositol 1,4,5-triphosphate receptor associated 1-like isoform X4 n=1 Tax=Myxocyprinus asiaticus TaxID=70543 RepID=UPI002221D70F|nr:inositol 1,4,5-triphosphate receptor associated 1-like isoform X4 [Myxocyprinus asiaticus]